MRLLIQRVSKASVKVEGECVGKINKGFLVFLGITHGDTKDNVDYLVNKLYNLRVFEDENEKMNLSLKDVGGEILAVSQFTLYANTKKGNRPSFTDAQNPNEASENYDRFNEKLREEGVIVETGVFGADMKVSFTNDGPVTILLDTDEIMARGEN